MPDAPVNGSGICSPDWDEEARLAALDRYAILDTGRESNFDDIAELAADILDAPIAVVNFIAADRQWFKAEKGIGQDSLPLDVSICRYAILQPGVFVVPRYMALTGWIDRVRRDTTRAPLLQHPLLLPRSRFRSRKDEPPARLVAA